MKLWLISQDEIGGYDTYDSAVVCAETEEEARHIQPTHKWNCRFSAWASSPEKVKVKEIGEALLGVERGVVLSSFNAG